MARKKYSCDFETTTNPDDCRVWAYGWMEIASKKNYEIDNSLDKFMTWAIKSQADLYFHNLKFDGSFIVNWLLKNGYKYSTEGEPNTFKTIISKMGQWYMVEICMGYKGKRKLHTVIYDSLKKLPFPVKKIAKDFKLEVQKGDIDYHVYRPVGHIITDEERSYIKNDIEIIADALQIQFNEGLTKMTIGSDSMSSYKTIFGSDNFERYFPSLSEQMDDEIRRAYRGGFTWVNELFQGKTLGEGIVFDVNSLYPSQMYDRPLPYGVPLFFRGKYETDKQYPLYIQHIRCEFELKENKIPTIQIKNKGWNRFRFKENEYLKSSDGEVVDLYVTNVDLELIQEHYSLFDVEYVDGWKFKQAVGLFKNFIDKWMYVKTHSDGAKKLLAKLRLNNLYGKFGTNPDVTGKIPFLKESGALGFTLPRDENGDVIKETKTPVYIPMGVFITSWARYTTITTAQKCYDRIIYCDTDSIHLLGVEIPDAIKNIVDDDKLGYWKHESTFYRAKFLRQKTYVEDEILKKPTYYIKNGRVYETNIHFNVKCAGMPDSVKEKVTFDNFEVGFTASGKLVPKQVNRGVVLVDTEFTIK